MELVEIFKVLANEHRLQMLRWIKSPEQHFRGAEFTADAIAADGGVCVQAITIKSGLAQSVVSGYLNSLKKAGLVEISRSGKWTYYRYNAEKIEQFLTALRVAI
ncbi:ArsR family transcriptional regulator [Actinobacillus equuli subsp. haemolyticus]|uniref:ArsR/SmtB family transcription factor n=1 Tax=Actinobacillus equuli TaxID=718 RepID=UPI0024411DB9|nr:helix-turn-helix transcriptional regulator [Actinobacillus equuli]WGE66822.1 ArsR family transcriptional regulator [Actinobacillus equuli subsp. haemolyticus]WGE82893.1 ArsR family transcriptional regulator [Actinobacillus equuli subsp. equuli]